ncbi:MULTISPECIES: response regulator [Actinomadura]|uniref:Response regulator n=1 Tax=Actinomadura litoris TaxID=2678616 RepID=A0A7K1L2H1_9ACTN|nr:MULTISPECIES: response regulator transcription factor [Actinomadura]MBT2208999.1 response regulator transcription factor [Actinomadura sp. NEAU-AAG7]MUN38436.1 response regulator [Actinomadura litoris]
MHEIRVLIVDDQPLVRGGLRATFGGAPDIAIVGESADGVEAVRDVRLLNPDIVLMDIHMPRKDGLEATREICAPGSGIDTKVIILTMFDQDEHLFEALRIGATGFILKDAPARTLVEAVHEVAAGEALLSASVTRRLVREFARRPTLSTGRTIEMPDLTDRELDVFRLLVRGHSNEEMAELLVLGASTVKSHVKHLYQKLGVRDRVQVVIYAYENGLV